MTTNQQNIDTALGQIVARGDWRAQLAADYTETAQRLQAAYAKILPELRNRAGSLTDRIAQWVKDNPDDRLTEEYVKGFKQYQDLLARIEVEMDDFARLLKNEAGIVEGRALEAGAGSALEMAQAVSGGAAEIVAAAWNRVSPEALAQAIGYVDSDAFKANVASFGENAAANLGDVVLSGIAQGKGPLAISNILQNWFALPSSWADTTVRTLQLYSYRSASIETYRNNTDVLDSWMWIATLDDRTCGLCISQHGTIHSFSEDLNSHYNCRCTPVPIVKGTSWAKDVTTGVEWFDQQSPEAQKSILGAGKFDLYQSGKLDWDKMVAEHEDDVYGVMKNEATLGQLKG